MLLNISKSIQTHVPKARSIFHGTVTSSVSSEHTVHGLAGSRWQPPIPMYPFVDIHLAAPPAVGTAWKNRSFANLCLE